MFRLHQSLLCCREACIISVCDGLGGKRKDSVTISYLEILEKNELFNDRCELENQFRSQYGEDVNDIEEQTEKFIPGYEMRRV